MLTNGKILLFDCKSFLHAVQNNSQLRQFIAHIRTRIQLRGQCAEATIIRILHRQVIAF